MDMFPRLFCLFFGFSEEIQRVLNKFVVCDKLLILHKLSQIRVFAFSALEIYYVWILCLSSQGLLS